MTAHAGLSQAHVVVVAWRRVGRIIGRAIIAVLHFYHRWISPMRPPACRFAPSCSVYAMTAIERFGVLRGGWLAVRRLSRCHPYHRGGHDPVPDRVDRREARSEENDRPGDDKDLVAVPSSPAGAPRCHTC